MNNDIKFSMKINLRTVHSILVNFYNLGSKVKRPFLARFPSLARFFDNLIEITCAKEPVVGFFFTEAINTVVRCGAIGLKPRLHRNANRMRMQTRHSKMMRTFDVDVFVRRGKQHSAVWRTFGEQPNAIRRLSVHQKPATHYSRTGRKRNERTKSVRIANSV